MLLKETLQILNFLVNKEQNTNAISIDQFNLLVPEKLTKVVKDKVDKYIALSEWERADQVDLTISLLKTRPELAQSPFVFLLDANGKRNLPDDFLIDDAVTYTQVKNSKNKIRKVHKCSGADFYYRQTTQLKKPTAQDPIYQIIGGKIECLPLVNTVLSFQYIRVPKIPYLDWYLDLNDYVVYRDEDDTATSILTKTNEISNLVLTGITDLNSDRGYLFWELVYENSLYKLKFYKDVAKTQLVCNGQVNNSGTMTLTQQNSSGISGTATITIVPYLTLGGNSLSEITAFTLNGFSGANKFYWDIVCTPQLYLNTTLIINTTFNIYSDSDKTKKIYSITREATSFTQAIKFFYNSLKITGSITIANACSNVLSDSFLIGTDTVYANPENNMTEFKIFAPMMTNETTLYYRLIEHYGLTTQFNIYADSSRTVLLMSNFDTKPYKTQLSLLPYSGSGYSGLVKLTLPSTYEILNDDVYSYTWTGDFGQMANLQINGITNNNSDNGKLYYSLVLYAGIYTIRLYKDAAKQVGDLVATGNLSAIPNGMNFSGSGISGKFNLSASSWQDEAGEIMPLSDPVKHQLSSLNLSGFTGDNTDFGKVYYKVIYMNIEKDPGYYVYLYKNTAHTNLVAYGFIPYHLVDGQPVKIGTIELTQVQGITGFIALDYIQDNNSTLNIIQLTSDHSHEGKIVYRSGNSDVANTLSIYQEDSDTNTYLTLPVSKTIELELHEDDKIDVLKEILLDMGVNLSREDIQKYALR